VPVRGDDHTSRSTSLPPLPPQEFSKSNSPAPADWAIAGRARLSEREAALQRLCALSDVSPVRRRRRVLAFSGVATLWVEAPILAAAHIPIGAL
jgi:hypothetical protein